MELQKFDSILDFIKEFDTQEKCIKHLEKIFWNNIIKSPFAKNSRVYVYKNGKYKCSVTKKYFTVLTGTIFQDTKLPLPKWFLAVYLLIVDKKGVSSYELAEKIHVTQRTAWKMMHKVRKAMREDIDKTKLTGVVEMDETFIGGKEGNKHLNKKNEHWYKKRASPSAGKTTVFGAVERGGKAVAVMVPDRLMETLTLPINDILGDTTEVITDDHYAYAPIHRRKERNHSIVVHSKHQYVFEDKHTNTIENFWSCVKRGISGIYVSVTKQHMNKYLAEFCFRYNTRLLTTTDRFNKMLGLTNLYSLNK